MRPIDNQHLRRAANLDQLNASNSAIAEITADDRQAFISEHEAECSAIRGALWAVGNMKCWYSEASLQQGEGIDSIPSWVDCRLASRRSQGRVLRPVFLGW